MQFKSTMLLNATFIITYDADWRGSQQSHNIFHVMYGHGYHK